MLISNRSLLFGAAIAVSQIALPAGKTQAGLFDWLCPRPAPAYPVATPPVTITTGYPQTACPTGCPTACPTGCPTGCPMTAMAPVVTTPTCPCSPTVQAAPVQPYVAGYAPAYQTGWYRVPTTYYRPTGAFVGVQPVPQVQSVTALQPCNSYTYQVRRTPLFGWLFPRNWGTPAPYAAPYVAGYAPPVTGYSSPYVGGYSPHMTNYANYAQYAAAYAQPATNYAQPATAYYAQPATTFGQPATTFGQPAPGCAGCATGTGMSYPGYVGQQQVTTVPAYPNGNGNVITQPAYPNGNGVQSGNVTTEPADQAPSITPNGNINTVPNGTYSYPPQQSNPNIGTVPDGALNRVPIQPGSSASQLQSIPGTSRNTSTPANSAYQVRPIPDPEANQNSNPTLKQAPPLLNTRERNASVIAPRTKTVTQAVWTTAKVTAPAASAPAPSNPPAAFWNDSGWQSAKSW